jgi:hypothetical protein
MLLCISCQSWCFGSKNLDSYSEKRLFKWRLDNSCEIMFKTKFVHILMDLPPSYTIYDAALYIPSMDYNSDHWIRTCYVALLGKFESSQLMRACIGNSPILCLHIKLATWLSHYLSHDCSVAMNFCLICQVLDCFNSQAQVAQLYSSIWCFSQTRGRKSGKDVYNYSVSVFHLPFYSIIYL